MHALGEFLHACFPLCEGKLVQAERNVLSGGTVREQGIVLKQDANPAFTRGNMNVPGGIENHAAIEGNAATIGSFQSCNDAEEHGLSRAGWAEHGERLISPMEGDVEREFAQRFLKFNFKRHLDSSSAPAMECALWSSDRVP